MFFLTPVHYVSKHMIGQDFCSVRFIFVGLLLILFVCFCIFAFSRGHFFQTKDEIPRFKKYLSEWSFNQESQ